MKYGIREYQKQQLETWLRKAQNTIPWEYVAAWAWGLAITIIAILSIGARHD